MLGQIKTARGIDTMPLETIFLEEGRDLFINGEITSSVANEFCEQFVYLLRKKNEPIRVWISSCGGSVEAGLRIYDMITVTKVPVYTIAYGPAYSMAGVLLASGTDGCRLMLPHSKMMLHPVRFEGELDGGVKDLQAKSDILQEYEYITNSILANHSGRTLEQIVCENSKDHYYSVREAIAYGYVDREVTIDDLL